jgi:hypothetical protein
MKTLKSIFLSIMVVVVFASCSSDDDGTQTDPTPDGKAELYATSNTNGNITRYDVKDRDNVSSSTFLTLSLDSEGIFYDAERDEVTKASRSLFQLNTYANISTATPGELIDAVFAGSADLQSPRDIAVNGNFYVVADNAEANGRFFVYNRTSNGFTLRNVITVDFEVWGITFVGNDLYAVVDNTSDLTVFTNFLSNTSTMTLEASKRITIEGIVRTHGIAYDGGTMILTDIGAATGAGADTDGAIHVITNFQSKFNAVADGGTMAVAGNQIRIEGSSTLLGNPVAAEFDAETNTIFIAERANGGGRILAFTNFESGGNIEPSMNAMLSGASSIYFHKEE